MLWMFTVGLFSAGDVLAQPQGDRPKSVVHQAHDGIGPPGDAADRHQTGSVRPAPSRDPKALLERALWTMEGYRSVSAKIVQKAELFGQHLVGSGVYLEQRSGGVYQMRLGLKIQLGDQSSSLLQVCDGRTLWTKRNSPGEEDLSRIDVARAMEGLRQSSRTGGGGHVEMLPGLGGLAQMIRGLLANFDFTTAEPGSWGDQDVWRLRGDWKPLVLAKLLPDQKATIEAGKPADLGKLPRQLPDHVVVFLQDQESPFLFRIEYRRAVPAGMLSSAVEADKAMVTMELPRDDVYINAPIDPNRFIFSPGELKFEDRTAKFLQSLRARK